MKLIILLNFLVFVHADIVEDTVQRLINFPKTEACDNFYRHACPLKSNGLTGAYTEQARSLANDILNSPNRKYSIMADFRSYDWIYRLEKYDFELPLYPEYTLEELTGIYYDLCEKGQDSTILMEYFERYLTNFNENGSQSISHLSKSENCTSARQQLETHILKEKTDYNLHKKIMKIQKTLQLNYLKLVGAELAETNSNIKNGIEKVATIFDDIKTIYKSWVKDTKWVKNNNSMKFVLSRLEEVNLVKDFTKMRIEYSKTLKDAEEYYQKCKQDIQINSQHANALCMLCAVAKEKIFRYDDGDNAAVGFFNGFNSHPSINLALPFYLAVNDIKTTSGRIGFIGTTLAHEIGHSLVENYETSKNLPFFSKIATKCIQDTYRKTCDEFEERSCTVEPHQVRENGPDILASQLAYKYFRNVVGAEYDKIYEPLNVTHEQLYFYSFSAIHCDGDPSEQERYDDRTTDHHSASNIRVNVMAQIPEFKTAFDCSADSRMVKVVKEQCFIYGENAPMTKKFS